MITIGVGEIENFCKYKNNFKLFEFTNAVNEQWGFNPNEIQGSLDVCMKTIHSHKNKLFSITDCDYDYYIGLDFGENIFKNYLSMLFGYVLFKKIMEKIEKERKLSFEKSKSPSYNLNYETPTQYYSGSLTKSEKTIRISIDKLSKILNCSKSGALALKKKAKDLGIIKVIKQKYKDKQIKDMIIFLEDMTVKYDIQDRNGGSLDTFFNKYIK